MKRAFGLDLAGYSTTGSAIAAGAHHNAQTMVTILDGHCFAEAARGSILLAKKSEEEIECLRRLFVHGKVYIDVPIDLQDLLRPESAKGFIWQLTKRPVDEAFEALCPLADRIGSCVARMRNIWIMLGADTADDPLGKILFETYPKASLKIDGKCCEGYKGRCLRQHAHWTGAPAAKEMDRKRNDALAKLLNVLAWQAEDGFAISNDEFDAAICALTGLHDQLRGRELDDEINRRIGGNHIAPRGYALVKGIPSAVVLRRKTLEEELQ